MPSNSNGRYTIPAYIYRVFVLSALGLAFNPHFVIQNQNHGAHNDPRDNTVLSHHAYNTVADTTAADTFASPRGNLDVKYYKSTSRYEILQNGPFFGTNHNMTLNVEILWAIADKHCAQWAKERIRLHINKLYRHLLTAKQRASKCGGVSWDTVDKAIKRFEWTGDPTPEGTRLDGDRVMTQGAKAKVLLYIKERPDLYLREITDKLVTDGERRYAESTICSYFISRGITCKALDRRARQRDEILRAHYRHLIANVDPRCLVFLDEVACAQNAALRRRGRSFRGTRASISEYLDRGTRYSGIGACSWSGGVIAFDLREENVTGVVFDEFIYHHVCPHLNPFSWADQLPNSVVVVDNASWHRAAGCQWKRYVEACGARVLFLPPYSPDFNPIELVWHELKARLKAVGYESVRVDPVLYIRDIMDNISRAHVQAYCRKCGYKVDDQDQNAVLMMAMLLDLI